MTDTEILRRIHDLVASEHEIRAAVLAGTLSPDDEHKQLSDLEEQLDQQWDLLRRRRAARRVGVDPDQVTERPAAEVEGYIQ